MVEDSKPFGPLSPAVLHILLALASESRHGYGIMQEISRQSAGRYRLGPGTLYENLQKLLEEGLVEECAQAHVDEDSRRRYYRLSKFGRKLLSTEIRRLEDVVVEAKAHLGMRPRRA